MTVSLAIKRPAKQTEFFLLGSEDTAVNWVGEVARRHHLEFLTGSYPVWIHDEADLDKAICELEILREERHRSIDAGTWRNPKYQLYNKEIWDTLLEQLKRLKHETGWEASFG